jgi:hypothetical protein
MKKLFITVPLMGMFLFNSCSKETETVIETENETVVVVLNPFEQTYYSPTLGYSSATVNYSVNNQGDKEISSLLVKFEATTSDGSIYSGSDYIFNLAVNDIISSQVYISVADKECKSVKIKKVEITTY